MIDDVSFLESFIKQRLPTVTVFQNSTRESEVEIDVQNLPGRQLSMIRILLSRANAARLRQEPELAQRVASTVAQALEEPSDDPEAVLDLRDEL